MADLKKIKRCTNCELAYNGAPAGRCPLIIQEPNITLDQKLMMVYFTSIIGCDSCVAKERKPQYLITEKTITEAVDLIRTGGITDAVNRLKEREYEDPREETHQND